MAQEGGEQVIAQCGVTAEAPNCECFKYAPRDEIRALIARSELVIAQAGYGSCFDVLEIGRPLIVVPRKKELGECQDNQVELANHLRLTRRAIEANSLQELRRGIAAIRAQPVESWRPGKSGGLDLACRISAELHRQFEMKIFHEK
ncbi:hypothetical protein GRI69_04380 [Erythrobacter vulgaris]|uniref:Glycosyl transferase family 28 C-terminal domain-containing protein n=1 Tax=Qipengyuania vulgaris TaxID=291985 RepID=A0A844XR40_9SPHN|nr:glycosyltransferase [Qipengyuania vulgaris]MXO47492.1 hypothetical protein [Qipengyuania vulgaris]